MNLKRVKCTLPVLAAFLFVVTPRTAQADGLNISFSQGKVSRAGGVVSNNPKVSKGAQTSNLAFVGRSPAPLGPQLAGKLGSFLFTTGPFIGPSPSTPHVWLYGPGGSIQAISNSSFFKLTGIKPNTILFNGSFTGTTTWTQLTFPSASCVKKPSCLNNFNFFFELQGPVAGKISKSLAAAYQLPHTSGTTGFIFAVFAGFKGPKGLLGNVEQNGITVVAPEPATLGLFVTGLMGLAGLRRRLLGS